MRAVWLNLLAGLALVVVASPALGAQPPGRWEVDGYGRTADAAEQIALEGARAKVENYLRVNYEERFGWQAPEAILLPEHLQQRWGPVVQLSGPAKPTELKGGEQAFKATAKVQITPQYQAEVNRLVREHQVLGRHLIAARVLAALVIVLVVAGGYLRLEEATRGYYTTLLRLSAAAVLLLTAGALWLSF